METPFAGAHADGINSTAQLRERPERPESASERWLTRLVAYGPERNEAIEELHALLLKAARLEVNRRRSATPQLRGDDQEDLAYQSADDALVAILRKLGDFRGESRFTTWAYKFAVLEAATKVRRRAWQSREIPLDSEGWNLLADDRRTPQHAAETKELLTALQEAIENDLTQHQREVFVAVVLNEVPIDVMADRLVTTRGALYKTIHDARRKLRAALGLRGIAVGDKPPTERRQVRTRPPATQIDTRPISGGKQ